MSELNINEVRLMGTIEKIGDLKCTTYSMIDILINIKTLNKNSKTNTWENTEKKASVVFFGKPAESIALLSVGTDIFVMGEVNTRINISKSGMEYSNTSIIAKKYQIISNNSISNAHNSIASKPIVNTISIDDFDDSIPF
jgi:single-stranded DNA-binding protein